MNRRTYRSRWLLYHSRYEKKGLSIFRKAVRDTANLIHFDQLTKLTYETSINYNVKDDFIRDAFFNMYFNVGVSHGKRVGKEINKELKNFDSRTFEGNYRNFISKWLIENAGTKITSVRQELIEYLLKFIGNGIKEGKDIRVISRELKKHILSRRFYRWQVMRIVRTETTAAANQGAVQAGESTGVVWEKQWVSSKDGRTRRRPDDLFDHYEMDGIRVPKESKFNVNGDLIDYPGDPKGQAANTINCRCTVAVVPKRDSDGRLVRTSPLFI